MNCRILLDMARMKIQVLLQCRKWETLRGNRTEEELVDYIYAQVQQHPMEERFKLSRQAIKLVCNPNPIRCRGNESAHTASEADLQNSVLGFTMGSHRNELEEIFTFLFDKAVDHNFCIS